MRELRQARGLSLRALATRALTNKSQLQAFETGKESPSPSTVRRIDEALDARGELIAFLQPDPAPLRHGREAGPAGDRRGVEFAPAWSAAVTAATSLWRQDAERALDAARLSFDAEAFLTPAVRWLTSPLDERPSSNGPLAVGPDDVAGIREATSMFRALDNRYGGALVRDRVVRFLHTRVAPLLTRGGFDARIGRDLHSAAAELAQLAAWTSYDSGLHGLGQRHLIQALRLAMAASDRPLGAEILAAMSHQAAYLHAPEQAVDLARAAGRVAASAGVAAIVAEAAVLEAQGLAGQGDEAGCSAALARAERALDRADRDADPQWLRYFDEAYLSAKFGHCFVTLGRGDLAVRFAQRSMQMDKRYVRGRQFNLCLLAQAYARLGEVEQAARIGREAAELTADLRSARARDYLRELAVRLATHSPLPAVREFREAAHATLPPTTEHGAPFVEHRAHGASSVEHRRDREHNRRSAQRAEHNRRHAEFATDQSSRPSALASSTAITPVTEPAPTISSLTTRS